MQLCRFYHPGRGSHWGLVEPPYLWDLTLVDRLRFGTLARLLQTGDMPGAVADARPKTRVEDRLLLEDIDNPPDPTKPHLLPPIDEQEVWSTGLAFDRDCQFWTSRSATAADAYAWVSEAERPLLGLKAMPRHCAGYLGAVHLRDGCDATCAVPSLAVLLDPDGEIVGYTGALDVWARDLEVESPLYWAQARTFAGCCALGPVITLPDEITEPRLLTVQMRIFRGQQLAYAAETKMREMRRSVADLVGALYEQNTFPEGAYLLTGAGFQPPDDFCLHPGDRVEVTTEAVGVLKITVRNYSG